jgi:hypothetical protein
MHDTGKMKRQSTPSDSDDEYPLASFGFSSQELAEADGVVQSLFDLAGHPLVQAATRSRARSEGPSTPMPPKYSKVNKPVISPLALPLTPPPVASPLTLTHLPATSPLAQAPPTTAVSMYLTSPLVTAEPKKNGGAWKYYVIFSLPSSRGGVDGPGIYSEW